VFRLVRPRRDPYPTLAVNDFCIDFLQQFPGGLPAAVSRLRPPDLHPRPECFFATKSKGFCVELGEHATLIARLSQAEAPFLVEELKELPSGDLGALSEWVKVLKEKVLRGMRTRRAESIGQTSGPPPDAGLETGQGARLFQ